MAPTGNLNASSAGPDVCVNRITPASRLASRSRSRAVRGRECPPATAATWPFPARPEAGNRRCSPGRKTGHRPASQRAEDHEDLVAVVAGGDAQRPGPAADHPPAQPAVEALKAGAAPQRQVKLLKTHLLAGDAPGLRHQGAADSLAPEGGVRLQTVDGSPVRHQRAQLTLDVEP